MAVGSSKLEIRFRNHMLIRVKVFPNSKEQLIEKKGDGFEIRVKEKPIQGQANQAVIDALADYFKCPRQNIKLIKGLKQRNKLFEINGLNY